jgi:hypothetical protein
MKKTKIPFYPKISLICTDGSTTQTNFLCFKDDFYINPDIKSNNAWLPNRVSVDLDELSNKSSKFRKYEFDFECLIKE